MAGYNDTRNLIIEALMGRQAGTEIQPEKHQAYALNMLNYVRSVELVSSSTLVGLAEESTVPVQPDQGKVCYIAGVGQDRTVTFSNFIDDEGNPISITTGEMEGVFVILLWNMEHWVAYTFNTNIISSAESANFYYGYNIRKTYASVAAMNADSVNPIGTDGRLIKIGELVTVVNSTTPAENGYYSYEGSENGWLLQSGFSFEIVQTTGTDINKTMSQKAVTDELALKAAHGYESNPKTLKEVDDEVIQLAGEVGDTPQSVKVQRHTSYETGFFINRNTGLPQVDLNMKVSPFTPISNNDAIRIKGYDSNQITNVALCVFYDIYKKRISTYYSGIQGVVTITIPPEEIPQGAEYIRSTALVVTEDAYVQTSISNTINKIDAQIKEGKVQNYVLAQQLEVNESSNASGWYLSKPIPRLNIKQITVEGIFNDSLAITYYGFLDNVVKETYGVGSTHAQIIIDDVPDDCFYFITRSASRLPVITISEIGSNNEAELRERENVKGIFENYTSILNQNISDASDVGNGWYRTTLLAIPDNCQLKYNGRTIEDVKALEFFNVFKTSIGVVNGSGSLSTKVIEVEPPQGTAFVQATYISSPGSLIISTKGKSSFINSSSAEDFEKRGLSKRYSNNLINEQDTILSSINYGQPNASHALRIDSTVRRICFDVILPKSINKTSSPERERFIRVQTLEGLWTPLNVDAFYSTPKQLKTASKPQDTRTTWNPFPETLSGVVAMDYYYQSRVHRNRDPLGDRVFSMWLKGVSSYTNEPTKEEVISRSEYLESIQDIYIDIADDTFTIGRDGIGEDDSVFNGGVTSTIFTTSLKHNGEYKTAIELYDEITAANLTDFNVKFFALTDSLSCADIVQYGKFKLVGKFSQISERGETETLLYDSFPLFIFAANREMRLTVDFIIPKEGMATIYVNGKKNGASSFPNMESFDFTINQALTGCRVENLEVFYNSLGDAEIIGNNIASERTPLIFGLMGHGLEDKYEAASSLGTSVPKMIALATSLRERGYNMLSADDLSAYYNGFKKLPAKNAFIITDDYRLIEWMYSNTDARSSFHQMGLKIIFAMVINSCIDNNLDKNLILSAIQNGCSFVSHSYYHDVPMDNKSSISFYYELLIAKEYMNENYFNQNIFVYPWHGGYRAQEVMLEYSGYSVAVDSGSGTQSVAHNSKFSTPFRLNRFDIGDGTVMPQF